MLEQELPLKLVQLQGLTDAGLQIARTCPLSDDFLWKMCKL